MKNEYDVIIVGAGPSGLFAAHVLREKYDNILMIDSGKSLNNRNCPDTPYCNCDCCSILEGEGGAGGFSDGKITLSPTRGTNLLNDVFSENDAKYLFDIIQPTLEEMASEGYEGRWWKEIDKLDKDFIKNEKLTFNSYPLWHFGSDGARNAIKNLTKDLERDGVEIRWREELEYLMGNQADNIRGIITNRGEYYGDKIILATGSPGMWLIEAFLMSRGIELETDLSGIGIRFETPREVMKEIQDVFYDFKIEYTSSYGIHLRSFCVNDGGSVVNENYRKIGIRGLNGHSFLNEDLKTNYSNMAIIARITYDEATSPTQFVKRVAQRVNSTHQGKPAVVSWYDYKNENKNLKNIVNHNTNKKARPGNLLNDFPIWLYESFKEYIEELSKDFPGFGRDDNLIYAPELKYFGRKVPIDKNFKLKGTDNVYIVGSTTGYIDSFASSALSGIIAAKDING